MMNRLITFLALFTLSTAALAGQSGYAVDYLRGEGSVNGIKLAYQYHLGNPLNNDWPIEVTLESSVNFWEYGDPNEYDTNFVLAVSPIVRLPLTQWGNYPIEGEFGIGVALLDDTEFAGKDVSTHYQFEDRLGIGTYWGKNKEYRLSLRYIHYSNAGFKKPNPGLDFISLSFSQRL